MRVLLVEDDAGIANFVKRGLEAEGYAIDTAATGEQALAMSDQQPYRLVILDLMLPAMDGIEVCRILRRDAPMSYILMLTAKDRLQDKISGFRMGADDYLTKPFEFDELLARMRALLRRDRYHESQAVLTAGDLTLDVEKRTAHRGGRTIELTCKEFALLHHLMLRSGKVLSRKSILNDVWGYRFDPGTNVVDVYIRYLRRKIDDGYPRQLIQAVRGVGYTITG